MSLTVSGSSITFPDSSTQNTAATGFGFKNRIINGDMRIDQRNAGASVTPTNLQYTVDRWFAGLTQASKFTVQQNAASVTPPVGFTNYLGCTSSSAYSVLTGDTFYIAESLEGFNASDLAWGTANAQAVTLSFWVRSSLTGAFGGSITNRTARSYPFSYTINSANTWEQKTVTIAGDTSGTWPTNNTASVSVYFGLGSGSTYSGTAGSWAGSVLIQSTGSTSVVGTNGATFYITGVQLEKGSTATSFDYRPYGTELALCQRYYHKLTGASGASGYQGICVGQVGSTTSANLVVKLPVSMRATPTTGYGGTVTVYDISATPSVTSMGQTYLGNDTLFVTVNASGGGLTTARCCSVYTGNASTNYMDFSAEL